MMDKLRASLLEVNDGICQLGTCTGVKSPPRECTLKKGKVRCFKVLQRKRGASPRFPPMGFRHGAYTIRP